MPWSLVRQMTGFCRKVALHPDNLAIRKIGQVFSVLVDMLSRIHNSSFSVRFSYSPKNFNIDIPS
jgi:hypothetical protein